MKYHYINEIIQYSAIGEADDIASYDFEWKFDDGDILTGPVVNKAWYTLGDHQIQLTTTDRENGYCMKENLNVSILLRAGVNSDVKHSIFNKVEVLIKSNFKNILSNISVSNIYMNYLKRIGVEIQ